MNHNTVPQQSGHFWTLLVSSRIEHFKLYWQQLSPRSKRVWLLLFVAACLGFLWLVAVAPALKTLRDAPDRHRLLNVQLEHMQRISAEAKSLQKLPQLNLVDAQKALQNTVTQRLGANGQVSITGNRAILTIKNATPTAVAEFLTDARINARAIPEEVKIMRSTVTVANWDGSMTLTLPAK